MLMLNLQEEARFEGFVKITLLGDTSVEVIFVKLFVISYFPFIDGASLCGCSMAS